MHLINDVIEYCNGDIQLVADCYHSAVNLNRAMTIIIILLLLKLLKESAASYKLDSMYKRKLKEICKIEKRPIKHQVKYILEMYIDAYEDKNSINWDKYLY